MLLAERFTLHQIPNKRTALCAHVALPSVIWSPFVHLRMLKEGKRVIQIYFIIKYTYLRIKISYLIQNHVAIKRRGGNLQLFGAGRPQVHIHSQNYVLVTVKAGMDAAYMFWLESQCEAYVKEENSRRVPLSSMPTHSLSQRWALLCLESEPTYPWDTALPYYIFQN